METIELDYFEENKNKNESSTIEPSNSYPHPLQPLDNTLNAIFPEQSQENRIVKARTILGEVSSTLSDEQIEDTLSEFDYLANCWLDTFERQTFGKTIKELNK